MDLLSGLPAVWCLNAPYGAPCFLTISSGVLRRLTTCSLNALYGAPAFQLTPDADVVISTPRVLMHLMVLRAFWPSDIYADNIKYLTS